MTEETTTPAAEAEAETPPPTEPTNGAAAEEGETSNKEATTASDDKDTKPDESATPPISAPVTPTAELKVDFPKNPQPRRDSSPRRNPGSTMVSVSTGEPLPSIEECLFGMPKDLDKGERDDESFHFVTLNVLRRVASQGIDDDDENAGSFRGVVWRLLLGFLPSDRREWDKTAEKHRSTYHSFVQELFCIEDRDIDGSELRGHHSKRHTDRGMTKKERRERERKRQQKQQQREKEAMQEGSDKSNGASSPRCPIKLVEGDSNNKPQSAPSTPTAAAPGETDADGGDLLHGSISEVLLNDDLSSWNMTVREQKILERLTNHDAINQLLVKRDCLEWNNFLENATLLDEIRKDVNRTHPHLYFYLEPNDQLGARRYGALERILFVWAKLNKGVRYVQGMNEIVGTLYYVLANDFNGEWADHAEPDTYSLFNVIMSEMRDIFVADMDTADTGIVGRIDNMQNLLHLHDPRVKSHLVDMGIDASFYAVRWLTTLLSREFLLPDTIRLWDSMFASTHKENFLRYVCVTMVLKIREQLLLSDFSTSLMLLQKYPTTSMDELLDASRALWIYESQITMACLKGGLTLHQALQAIPPPDKVIMAFGLQGGLALTNREQLQQAGAAVRNKMGRGVQSVSHAGQGILGGARRFVMGRIRRSKSSEGIDKNPNDDNNKEVMDNQSEAPPRSQRVRGVPFRTFSFGARARSEGDYDSAPQTDDGEEVANGETIARTVSDTDAM